MHKSNKRIAAAVVALALGFSTAGTGAFAPIAGAAETITAGQASTVDITKEASLTIEKYLGDPVGPHGTEDLLTLPGFEADFTIQQVTGIDLTTVAGWTTVKQLSDAVATSTAPAAAITNISGLSLGTGAVQTTTDDGNGKFSTTFTNLDVGVYLVTETPQNNIKPAKPFFVTLPYTTANGDSWNYDLTVKPKNQDTDYVTKSVEDALATLGSTSTYTIEMAVPDEDGLSSISIKDALPSELNYVANSTKVYHTSKDVANEITAFTNTSSPTTLDLEITDSGALSTLKAKTLIVEFDATIVALPAGTKGGDIDNHASIDLTIGGVTTTRTTDPEDPTTTRLGTLTITKVDSDDETITEGSAEFQLWSCTLKEGKWEVVDGPLAKDLDETTVTDFPTTSGIATITGVQMADYVNDAEVNTAEDTLCVVETQAPEGYVLNPEPQPVTVTVTDPYDYTMTADVTNLSQKEGGTGQLPETGGMGTMALIAAGVVVAAAGGAAAVRGNRARR